MMDDWIKWAVGLAWAAGVGVATYAIAQESRITALEVKTTQAAEARTKLEKSTEKLATVLTELNTNVRVLSVQLGREKEFSTVGAEEREEE